MFFQIILEKDIIKWEWYNFSPQGRCNSQQRHLLSFIKLQNILTPKFLQSYDIGNINYFLILFIY